MGAKIGGGLLALLVLLCVAGGPLWSRYVAHSGPNTTHVTDRVGGRDVVSRDGVPLGPTGRPRFFLGADAEGRDVMVRLLYGGRTSLLVAFCAALLTVALATVSGLVAGWSRGVADGLISRSLEAIWAFPAILLAGALGTALAVDGLRIGPFELGPQSLVLPVLVIGLVSVPYFARPLRAEVRTLRDEDFVVAARAIGAGPGRILAREVLPNVGGLILAVAPVILANALLLEAALSFLGVGVQPPDASWGTLIAEGVDRIETAPQLAIAPGVALLATVLAANLVARGVGGHLDRRLSPRVAW